MSIKTTSYRTVAVMSWVMVCKKCTDTCSNTLPQHLTRSIDSSRCVACDNRFTGICPRCKTAVYCGPTCQRRHWPEHKKMCVKTVL
jgi:hypothetical protein